MMPPLPGDVQWFPAEIRKLIAAIKKQEALYNPKNECFGLRDFQARAWKAVAEQVGGGKTDAQCRDKWNCLRGTYRRHVRTEATNAVKRRSGWPWAGMMNFIKPFVMEQDIAAETYSRSIALNNAKPTATTQTVKPTQVTLVKPGMTLTHKANCPLTNQLKAGGTLTPINQLKAGGTLTPITLSNNMFPGGIIFKSNGGIGIVQPNQGNVISMVQPSQVNLVQSSQAPVMKIVTTQPSSGVGVVQPTKKTVEKETPASTKSKSLNPETIEVDLKRVKRDPDAGAPTSTEFIDMEVAIKKEPMEDDELQLPETFTYLPEDPQDTSQDGLSSRDSDVRSPDKNLPDQSHEDIDSNELFMRSTVCHMRKLSAYDQSVFKLKVQQLLHEMMFPKQP